MFYFKNDQQNLKKKTNASFLTARASIDYDLGFSEINELSLVYLK